MTSESPSASDNPHQPEQEAEPRQVDLTDQEGNVVGFVVPDVVESLVDDFLKGAKEQAEASAAPPRKITAPSVPEIEAPKADPDSRLSIFRRRSNRAKLSDEEPAEPAPEDYKYSTSRILGTIGRPDFGAEQLDAVAHEGLGIVPRYELNLDTGEDEPHYTDEQVKQILEELMRNDARKGKA